jgi:DNA-binding CsgD family transcriptional regulator/catechol 2,3-dioxygenase-like lactoylglutathione lyase family enzyme
MEARRGRGRPRHPDVLTPAEWAVLDWVRHGMTRREIARRRGSSVDAVKYHLANITGKLGLGSTAELRRWAGYPASGAIAKRKDITPMNATELSLGRIGQVSLAVRDIPRAERFYGETLGLRHIFTFGDLGFFDCDGVRLYLQAKPEDRWRPGSVLYFAVDDIHAARDELMGRGVAFTDAPHLIFTHEDGTEEWMSFFEDGEGNTLALMAKVQPTSDA